MIPIIQRATAQDAPGISELISGFIPLILLRPNRSGAKRFLDSIAPPAIESYIENPDFDYIIAVDDQQIAAAAALREGRHIYHLFVAAEFQRKGLATMLWRRLQCGIAEGVEEITVNSTRFAIPVYQRFGFTTTGSVVERDGIAYVPMKAPISVIRS